MKTRTPEKLPLWTCCAKSHRTKFCPNCGTQMPNGGEPQAMLAEIDIEYRKYTKTLHTHASKANDMEALLGCKPYDCGLPLLKVEGMIINEIGSSWDHRGLNSKELKDKLSAMSESEIQEFFDSAIRGIVKNLRGQALAAAKNAFHWGRWSRILSTLIKEGEGK